MFVLHDALQEQNPGIKQDLPVQYFLSTGMKWSVATNICLILMFTAISKNSIHSLCFFIGMPFEN